ncbi:hypothetical protein GQ457_05G005740 [Hibiscus cannabinus]
MFWRIGSMKLCRIRFGQASNIHPWSDNAHKHKETSNPLKKIVVFILCMVVPKDVSVEVDSSFLSINQNRSLNCTSIFQNIRLSGCRR